MLGELTKNCLIFAWTLCGCRSTTLSRLRGSTRKWFVSKEKNRLDTLLLVMLGYPHPSVTHLAIVYLASISLQIRTILQNEKSRVPASVPSGFLVSELVCMRPRYCTDTFPFFLLHLSRYVIYTLNTRSPQLRCHAARRRRRRRIHRCPRRQQEIRSLPLRMFALPHPISSVFSTSSIRSES